MTPEEFRTTIMDPMLNDAKAIIKAKGNDYAEDDDFLANFKTAAEDAGVTVLQAWYIYYFKHHCAIRTYVKDGQVESEDIRGRIHDEINYLLLLAGIIAECKEPSEMNDNLEAARKALTGEELEPWEPVITSTKMIDNTGITPDNPNWTGDPR